MFITAKGGIATPAPSTVTKTLQFAPRTPAPAPATTPVMHVPDATPAIGMQYIKAIYSRY